MRRFVFALLAALAISSPAQARLFTQPELDALVAPIALYPDGLISDILVASTFPDQVEAAARLPKDAQPDESWSPAVKQLLNFPDILARMVESPQWTRDLGEAFLAQEPHVLDTVQGLRRRAQQQGSLKSNEQYTVSEEGSAIVVQPRTEVVYAPYYDPYVVYGPWWWPAYRPVYWAPWVVTGVVVSAGFFYATPHWHHRHVTVWHKHPHHHAPAHVHHRAAYHSKPYVRVPESQRKPIVSSTPQMHRFDDHRSRGGDWQRGHGQQQGRSDGHRSSGRSDGHRSSGNAPRSHHQMPAAPRFSETRAAPQQHSRPAPPQHQQRAPAPHQQRASAPPQQRASVPQQQQRAFAPQGGRGGEMRSSSSGAPRGGGWGASHGGGGSRSAGGGGHGGGGRGGRG